MSVPDRSRPLAHTPTPERLPPSGWGLFLAPTSPLMTIGHPPVAELLSESGAALRFDGDHSAVDSAVLQNILGHPTADESEIAARRAVFLALLGQGTTDQRNSRLYAFTQPLRSLRLGQSSLVTLFGEEPRRSTRWPMLEMDEHEVRRVMEQLRRSIAEHRGSTEELARSENVHIREMVGPLLQLHRELRIDSDPVFEAICAKSLAAFDPLSDLARVNKLFSGTTNVLALLRVAELINNEQFQIARFCGHYVDEEQPATWHPLIRRSAYSLPTIDANGTYAPRSDRRGQIRTAGPQPAAIQIAESDPETGRTWHFSREIWAQYFAQSTGFAPHDASPQLPLRKALAYVGALPDERTKGYSTYMHEMDGIRRALELAGDGMVLYWNRACSTTTTSEGAEVVVGLVRSFVRRGAQVKLATDNNLAVDRLQDEPSVTTFFLGGRSDDGSMTELTHQIVAGRKAPQLEDALRLYACEPELAVRMRRFSSGEHAPVAVQSRSFPELRPAPEEVRNEQKGLARGLSALSRFREDWDPESAQVSLNPLSKPAISALSDDEELSPPPVTRDIYGERFLRELIFSAPTAPELVWERKRLFDCLGDGDFRKKLEKHWLCLAEFVQRTCDGIAHRDDKVLRRAVEMILEDYASAVQAIRLDGNEQSSPFTLVRLAVPIVQGFVRFLGGEGVLVHGMEEPLRKAAAVVEQVETIRREHVEDLPEARFAEIDALYAQLGRDLGSASPIWAAPHFAESAVATYIRKTLLPLAASLPSIEISENTIDAVIEYLDGVGAKLDAIQRAGQTAFFYTGPSVVAFLQSLRMLRKDVNAWQFFDTLRSKDSVHLHQLANYYERMVRRALDDTTAERCRNLREHWEACRNRRRHSMHPVSVETSLALVEELKVFLRLNEVAKYLAGPEFCSVEFASTGVTRIRGGWNLFGPEKQTRFQLTTTPTTQGLILQSPNGSGKSFHLQSQFWLHGLAYATGRAPAKQATLPLYAGVVYVDRATENTAIAKERWATVEQILAGNRALIIADEPYAELPSRVRGSFLLGRLSALVEAGHTFLVAGHDHDALNEFAALNPLLAQQRHLSFRFDDRGRLRFLRALKPGAHPSCAIAVAKQVGIPVELFPPDPGLG